MALNLADIAILSRLLDDALALGPADREPWLAALPAEHQRHAGALRGMLAQEARPDDEQPLQSMPKLASDEAVAHADDRVGPYRLLREIGRGGMGSVWLAERADGAYKRQVALKLPRLAWGAGLAERMAREREIGMLLEHPNIARLYDAGVDERGRPFLALEYVDGQPIDAWCEAQGLGVRERLRLFVQVAKAVAYAHGRLVVHRDLKPSNVLVTRDGQAHLLDFGIAKLLSEVAPGEAGLTQQQGRVMTPHYASPEQVAGGAITVQSDVYSLGVLLYELLTGVLPIDPKRSTLGAVEEAILEGDAPLASSRVKERTTARTLRGEVDAILAKAMQPEPGRRYATAEALALDIERHLNGETVSARPDRLAYRLRKAVRRHWVGVSAAAAVLVAVIAGSGAAVIQAQRAAQQSERARLATEFVSEVFRVSTRSGSSVGASDSRAEPILDQGAKLIEARFPGQPDMQAEMYGVVGRIYSDIGANQLAMDYTHRQIRLFDRLAPDRERRARAWMLLASTCLQEGMDADAESYAAKALEFAAPGDALRPDALVLLGRVQWRNGKANAARESLAMAERLLTDRGLPASAALAWLQWSKVDFTNDFEQNKVYRQRALQTALNAEGPASSTAINMRIGLSHWLIGIHQFDESRQYIEAALSVLRREGGAGEIRAAVEEARYWSHLWFMRGASYAEAVSAIRRSRVFVASSPSPIPAVVLARLDYALGRTQAEWGALAEAESLMNSSVPVLLISTQSIRKRFEIIIDRSQLAVVMGRHDMAELLLNERLLLRKQLEEAAVPFAAFDWAWAAMNMAMKGEYERAAEFLSNAPLFGARKSDAIAGDVFARVIPMTLARVRLAQADAQGALRAKAALPPDALPDDESLFAERALHGEVQCALGETAEGLPKILESIRSISAVVSHQEPGLARLRAVAGLCALGQGNEAQASNLAALARAAFTAQPGVSPYYKAPLFKLERALGLKLPPV